MRVLALGGSGGMGRFAVETSMQFENISKIFVADINADAAIAFSNTMNEKAFSFIVLENAIAASALISATKILLIFSNCILVSTANLPMPPLPPNARTLMKRLSRNDVEDSY